MKKRTLVVVCMVIACLIIIIGTKDTNKEETEATSSPNPTGTYVDITNSPIPTATPTPRPPLDGGLQEGVATELKLYNGEFNSDDKLYVTDTTCAVQFSVTTQFDKITFEVAGGSLSSTVLVSLYIWHYSYDNTLKAAPIASATVQRPDDRNARCVFDVSSLMETLPGQNEYLMVVSNGTARISLSRNYNVASNVRLFINGYAEIGSLACSVHLVNTPKVFSFNLEDTHVSFKKATPESQIATSSAISSLNVQPDTWAAVDGLGRTLSSNEDVGSTKQKFVGMFYWIWHEEFSGLNTPKNLTEIIKQYPNAKNDVSSPAWTLAPNDHDYYFWDQPLLGYYSSADKYVIRKHAEMLADAGVDVIIFDCTNGNLTWTSAYTAVFETFKQARDEGVNTPQIAFILNFTTSEDTRTMLISLYSDIYKNDKYQDLWFYWDNKPLILAYADSLNTANYELEAEIAQFFTYRQPQPVYEFNGDTSTGLWGWLSVYPQTKYLDSQGKLEEMTVGVAQNWGPKGITAMNGVNVFGRSHTVNSNYSYSYNYAGKTIVANKSIANSMYYGLNFQEQWDYAIASDPDFVFITGWNEWVAGRQNVWPEEPGYDSVNNAFPDQYSDEYSRDIEPSNGELKDYYYYQLVENIRRFKGVSENTPVTSSAKATINVKGSISQWDNVGVLYTHYLNSTYDRNAKGYIGTTYNNSSMRNDIVKSKVAYDGDNIYIMVECAENLTSTSDSAWMRLFLDTDTTGSSKNWEGFEYVINRKSPTSNICYLEKSTDGWNWTVIGELNYSVVGKYLQISIPRNLIDKNGSGTPSFNFKWSDNMQADGNILDFYSNGDVAPGGRFTFVFN